MEVLGERGGRPVYENPSRQPVQHSFGVLMTRELRGDFGDPRRVPVDETAIARAAVELVQLQDQEHRPVGQVGPLPGGIHGRQVAVEMPCHRGREKVLQHRPLDPGVAKHEACRPRSPERIAQPAAALAPRRIQEHVNRVGPQGEPGCLVDPVELAIAAQKGPALEVGVLVPAQEHVVRQGSAVLRGLDVKLDEPAIPTRARARRPAERNLPVVPTFRDGVFRDLLPGSAERTPDRVCQREQTRAPNQADVGELHRALQELPVVGDLLHREPGRFPPPAERAGPPVEVSGIQVVDLHDGACVRERQDVRPLLLQADAGPGSIGRDMPVAVVAHRWQTDTPCRDRGGREGGGVVGWLWKRDSNRTWEAGTDRAEGNGAAGDERPGNAPRRLRRRGTDTSPQGVRHDVPLSFLTFFLLKTRSTITHESPATGVTWISSKVIAPISVPSSRVILSVACR